MPGMTFDTRHALSDRGHCRPCDQRVRETVSTSQAAGTLVVLACQFLTGILPRSLNTTDTR